MIADPMTSVVAKAVAMTDEAMARIPAAGSKAWRREREELGRNLAFFTRHDDASKNAGLVQHNASKAIDRMIALGVPYPDALAVFEILAQGQPYRMILDA